MEKNHISFIIIPHHKGRQKTHTLSKRKVKFITGISIFCLVVLTGVLVHYVLMNGISHKYKLLRKEFAGQQEKVDQYERTIGRLQVTISNYEEYVSKLNIMAGLKSSDVLTMEAGVGAGMSDGQLVTSLPPPADPNFSQINDINKRADRVEQNLSTLLDYFGEQSIQMAYTPSIKPTNGYISSKYGMRDDPFTGKRQMHWGIDIVSAEGNPVFATADGTIIRTGNDKISGNYIKVSHPITGFVTIYCHLSKINVRTGQKVKRGQVIGLVGSTGKAQGPHVHYEVQLNGKSKNPWFYLLEE